MTASTEKAAPFPAEVLATEAMVEAAAKAIHDHWQNGPGPHARSWEKCCKDLPGAAADFRAKARAGLFAAIMQDRADRQEERIREDDTERLRWLTRRIPGRVIRETVGVLSWTGDLDEWRAAIDRARRGDAS